MWFGPVLVCSHALFALRHTLPPGCLELPLYCVHCSTLAPMHVQYACYAYIPLLLVNPIETFLDIQYIVRRDIAIEQLNSWHAKSNGFRLHFNFITGVNKFFDRMNELLLKSVEKQHVSLWPRILGCPFNKNKINFLRYFSSMGVVVWISVEAILFLLIFVFSNNLI